MVLDDYLCDKNWDIESIVENLCCFDGDQAHMDSLYDHAVDLVDVQWAALSSVSFEHFQT